MIDSIGCADFRTRISTLLCGIVLSSCCSALERVDEVDETRSERTFRGGTVHATETYTPQITYPNSFTKSVNSHARLSGKPNPDHLLEMLKDKFGGAQRHQIDVERSSPTRLRVRVYGIQSYVIPGHRYWEYLFLDFSFGEVKEYAALLDQLDRLNAPQTYRNLLCQDLSDAETEQRQTYEIDLVASGKFAAGGQPSNLDGYHDMVTSNFHPELDHFASVLLHEAIQWTRSSDQAVFSTMTGCRIEK